MSSIDRDVSRRSLAEPLPVKVCFFGTTIADNVIVKYRTLFHNTLAYRNYLLCTYGNVARRNWESAVNCDDVHNAKQQLRIKKRDGGAALQLAKAEAKKLALESLSSNTRRFYRVD